MKKFLLLTFFSIFFMNIGNSQNSMWQSTTTERTSLLEKSERDNMPFKFELYNLNFEAFKALVATAPRDNSGQVSNVTVSFPNPNGVLENYIVYEAPVMEDELAARFPSIKSYVAKGINDKTASMRFSVTLFGLHAMLTSGDQGTFYIDTYTKDLNNYIVYSKKSLYATRTFTCFNQDETDETAGRLLETQTTLVNDGVFRQYRLAMACTIEYASFHVNAAGLNAGTLAQKKAAVLAAMVVTMTRVNGIYERDMSLRMNLVANNDLVIFIDSDNFNNNNAGTLINQSQSVIDANIGNFNYDIGHTVSTGGGGLAGLGVICNNSQKARGITGSGSPVGDSYDVDYVAHEMGHQFGGSHTFNNSCGNNVSTANSAEPGSGSTIMAYAGICAPNVQNNSDAYFHTVSIAQMTTRVLSTSCAASTANGNFAPVLDPIPSYIIPKDTPFVLTASATDANNDTLTYCWEQTDVAMSTQPPVSTSTTGPNFRSLSPVSSPSRYFPSLTTLTSGSTSNTWEVLPSVARSFTFAVTVRDNRTPNGGQTNRGNTVITVDNSGPLDVTSQNTAGISWAVGSSQTVTWAVNGTNLLPGASNVDILLSTDGGLTYPTVLVANTLNDGTETVVTPNVASANCRIMVKPTGNIFFDINTTNFAIGVTVTCDSYSNNTLLNIPDGGGANVQGPAVSKQIVVPTPTNTITDVNVTLGINHSYIEDLVIAMRHPDNTQVTLWNRYCDNQPTSLTYTFSDGSPVIPATGCTATTGTFGAAGALSDFNGKPTDGTWTLLAADFYNGDTGSIGTWTIELCYSSSAASTESFGLNNFNLYPNPNNGNFTVQFESDSTNDVQIKVNDIRGREVFSNTYENSGLFVKSLELNNVTSGIYLVTVQNGNKKEVKKIIVE